VGGVAEDEVKRYQDGNEAEYCAEPDAESVEGDVAVCWEQGLVKESGGVEGACAVDCSRDVARGVADLQL
jgi:hypothetical protein